MRAIKARETALANKRESLCRYIVRPAVAIPRLALRSTVKVLYTLRMPYRDGTTQNTFERGGHPLTRRWRGLVTPAKCGKRVKPNSNAQVRSAAEQYAAMTGVQRLKRVFNIDIEVCARCGGSVRVIACNEEQDVIDRILEHLLSP